MKKQPTKDYGTFNPTDEGQTKTPAQLTNSQGILKNPSNATDCANLLGIAFISGVVLFSSWYFIPQLLLRQTPRSQEESKELNAALLVTSVAFIIGLSCLFPGLFRYLNSENKGHFFEKAKQKLSANSALLTNYGPFSHSNSTIQQNDGKGFLQEDKESPGLQKKP